jgi:hypothetical protein
MFVRLSTCSATMFAGWQDVSPSLSGCLLVNRIQCSAAATGCRIRTRLVMPYMDGIAATRAIKERWPQIEIVAVTSFIEEEKVQPALQAGAAGYLLKDAEECLSADPSFIGRCPRHPPLVGRVSTSSYCTLLRLLRGPGDEGASEDVPPIPKRASRASGMVDYAKIAQKAGPLCRGSKDLPAMFT